ncbi:hypothetical protein AZE42_12851 [Rhizopogon vesiculosus]|uniref:Uncharacterized protein n=1 Tax=Rhizopogon vesiculosus TaxID=180088 RepID=A0A1J8QLQ9_9AGAM|nr:hypothetical protein AZE42_12851 [Rhizopogon vesiculosus]
MNVTNSTNVASPSDESALNPYTIIGPVVLGGLINASLFGCLVIQTYVYYASFAKDHQAIKLMCNANCIFDLRVSHTVECGLAQCLSLVITVKVFGMTSLVAFAVDENALITVSLTSRVVYDLTTAMGLATTSIVDRLVLWAIETGLITRYVERRYSSGMLRVIFY